MKGRPAFVSAAISAVLAGCISGGGAGGCAPDEAPLDCTPSTEPSWTGIYQTIIEPSCTGGSTGCHGQWGKQGDLDLSTSQIAYTELLGEARVLPGEPSCSLLVWRLEGTQGAVMPLSGALSSAEICAVKQWIVAGASR